MKIMKSIIMLILVMCLIFSLCACNDDTNENANETTEESSPISEPENSTTVEDDKITYTVTVVDEGNNPISGAMVQLCLDACVPSMTNESGVATFNLEAADYKVSFVTMPEGYSCEEEAFHFEEGSYELTITLKAIY